MTGSSPTLLLQGVLRGNQHTDADRFDHADAGEVHNDSLGPFIHEEPQTPAKLLDVRGNDVFVRRGDAAFFLLEFFFI